MITPITIVFAALSFLLFVACCAREILTSDEFPMSVFNAGTVSHALGLTASPLMLMPLWCSVSGTSLTITLPMVFVLLSVLTIAARLTKSAKREIVMLACEALALLCVLMWNVAESDTVFLLAAIMAGTLPMCKVKGRFWIEAALMMLTYSSVVAKTAIELLK